MTQIALFGILALCVALAVVLAIVSAALVEVFRQLADIRSVLSLDDRPISLDLLDRHLSSRSIGLPAAIEAIPEAMVVFLSTRCGTCRAIASAFVGGAPKSAWFVIEGDGDGSRHLAKLLSASADRVTMDTEGIISERIGLEITPAVLTFEYGELARAQAVSSPRQVMSLVPTVIPMGIPRDVAERVGGAAELAVATSERQEV